MTVGTAQKAMIAMLKVQERAVERGVIISLPTTDNCRYDAIIDDSARTYRVQVKYCDRRAGFASGAVELELTSYHRSGKLSSAGYTAEEIDALLVDVPRIDEVL